MDFVIRLLATADNRSDYEGEKYMKYNAFISYRHSELDMMVAKKIHKGLETFKVPRAVQKASGKKNIKRVFRDQEELPIGSDLGDNIRQALKASEFLIIICSPRSKESYWVLKEVETFIELHGRNHILAVLIEGEPEDSFPEQILQDETGNPIEPLAADVRGKNPGEVQKKLRTEILRLAAPILGCSYDDLKQRHRERRMRKAIAWMSVAVAAAVLFGMYSSYNVMLIQRNYRQKLINQSKFLAEESGELLKAGDRQSAVLVALEALPGKNQDRPRVSAAELALSNALRCYDTGNTLSMDRILKHELPVKDYSFYSDGTGLVSVDNGNGVYVWNLVDGEKMLYISPETGNGDTAKAVVKAAVTEEGKIFVARSDSFMLMEMDGTVLWKHVSDTNEIIDCIVDEKENLAVCESRNEVCIADLKSGKILDTVRNPLECSFSSGMVFSEDGDFIAIPHYATREEQGYISVYQRSTDQLKTVRVSRNYIETVCFTKDNQLTAVSIDAEAFGNLYGVDEKWQRTVEKINVDTDEILWKKDKPVSVTLQDKNSILKTRVCKDTVTGKEQELLYVASGQEVCTIDPQTGETAGSLNFGEDIVTMQLTADGPWGFVTVHSGIVHFCDLISGKVYNDNAVITGKEIFQSEVNRGTLVIREQNSPDLTVMKYHTGQGMKELETYHSFVSAMNLSEDDSYYAVEVGKGTEKYAVYFYKTETDELVNKWIPETEGANLSGIFLDKNTYFAADQNGNLEFYNVKNNKSKSFKVTEERISCEYMTYNRKFFMVTAGEKYYLVDLNREKTVAAGEMDTVIDNCALRDDGKEAVMCLKDKSVWTVNMDTEEMESVDLKGGKIRENSLDSRQMIYSGNGEYIACNCTDNMLRIVDMKEKKTVDEVPFFGENNLYIGFIEDTGCLIMQGSDYCIRIYDMENRKVVYASPRQYYMIREMQKDRKENILKLKTTAGMVIFSLEDCQPKLDMEDLKLCSTEKNAVFCARGNTVYRFPYLREEDLYEEAEKQFPGVTLTEEERIRFNVD